MAEKCFKTFISHSSVEYGVRKILDVYSNNSGYFSLDMQWVWFLISSSKIDPHPSLSNSFSRARHTSKSFSETLYVCSSLLPDTEISKRLFITHTCALYPYISTYWGCSKSQKWGITILSLSRSSIEYDSNGSKAIAPSGKVFKVTPICESLAIKSSCSHIGSKHRTNHPHSCVLHANACNGKTAIGGTSELFLLLYCSEKAFLPISCLYSSICR